MKTRTKKILSYVLYALILSGVMIWGCSCLMPKPDPLKGFQLDRAENPTLSDDYKNYIQNLPQNQKGYIGTIFIYKNDAGQHAVSIEIFEGNQNASWTHVLFYDKNDKRIKVTRYNHIKYQS